MAKKMMRVVHSLATWETQGPAGPAQQIPHIAYRNDIVDVSVIPEARRTVLLDEGAFVDASEDPPIEMVEDLVDDGTGNLVTADAVAKDTDEFVRLRDAVDKDTLTVWVGKHKVDTVVAAAEANPELCEEMADAERVAAERASRGARTSLLERLAALDAEQ